MIFLSFWLFLHKDATLEEILQGDVQKKTPWKKVKWLSLLAAKSAKCGPQDGVPCLALMLMLNSGINNTPLLAS